MKERFIRSYVCIALCAVLLLSAFVIIATDNVSAAQEGDFTFVLSSSLPIVATITEYTGPGGGITIPSTLGGYSVVAIGGWAFAYSSLTSVIIGTGITYVEEGAFYASTSLSHVTIPASVTFIGDYAFESCTSLTSITFLGLNVPFIGKQWIYDTSVNIAGHAYPNSNFPEPGDYFHGLPMGSTIFGSLINDNDMLMIWWALAIVVVAIILFLLYGRKEGKGIAPSEIRPAQWTANQPNVSRRDLLLHRDQAQAPPPRKQYNQQKPQSGSYGHCPWCGTQTTDSPFCGYCGGKLQR